MRRDVAQQLDQLKSKLHGYVALLVYRYGNLCIEANPFALLPIQLVVDGETKHLEDVANVAIQEDYHFVITPIFEDDFFAVGQAIGEAHPEFKQELKTFEGYAEDDPAGKYIFCTMPEVNKDRHDFMLKAVDGLYDECKGKMEVAQKVCLAKVGTLMVGASESEIDKLKDYVDEIVKSFTDVREQTHDTKIHEIEDAYAHYQKQQEEKKAQEDEKQLEQGNPFQMKLNSEN